jgi:hypothetical protein
MSEHQVRGMPPGRTPDHAAWKIVSDQGEYTAEFLFTPTPILEGTNNHEHALSLFTVNG